MSGAVRDVRARSEWMEGLLADPALADSAKVVALRLALHLNLATGRCDPSVERLAKGSGRQVRAVYSTISLLEQAGWIRRTGRKGRHSNQYALSRPATLHDSAGFNPAPRDRVEQSSNPARRDRVTLHHGAVEPCIALHPNSEANSEANSESLSPTPLTLFAADAPSAQKPKPGRVSKARSTAEDFERFWSAYPRLIAKAAARKAFDRACTKAPPAEILAGTKRFAAERADQDPKFTPHPTTWLNDERWADAAQPPSAARAMDRGPLSNTEIALRGLHR